MYDTEVAPFERVSTLGGMRNVDVGLIGQDVLQVYPGTHAVHIQKMS